MILYLRERGKQFKFSLIIHEKDGKSVQDHSMSVQFLFNNGPIISVFFLISFKK